MTVCKLKHQHFFLKDAHQLNTDTYEFKEAI